MLDDAVIEQSEEGRYAKLEESGKRVCQIKNFNSSLLLFSSFLFIFWIFFFVCLFWLQKRNSWSWPVWPASTALAFASICKHVQAFASILHFALVFFLFNRGSCGSSCSFHCFVIVVIMSLVVVVFVVVDSRGSCCLLLLLLLAVVFLLSLLWMSLFLVVFCVSARSLFCWGRCSCCWRGLYFSFCCSSTGTNSCCGLRFCYCCRLRLSSSGKAALFVAFFAFASTWVTIAPVNFLSGLTGDVLYQVHDLHVFSDCKDSMRIDIHIYIYLTLRLVPRCCLLVVVVVDVVVSGGVLCLCSLPVLLRPMFLLLAGFVFLVLW